MDVSFAVDMGDEQRRSRIYRGEIMVLPSTPRSLELVRFARRMIEEAFAPNSPRTAHRHLDVAQTVQILTRLKPEFIHDPRTRLVLRDVLLSYGCDPHKTYQDVPRLRAAYPVTYLRSGIAYAHHPHRDTWYSAPRCQLNWWMPLYDFEADQGMAFHPAYWGRAIRNGSSQFNYYHWNAVGRQDAVNHIQTDTRVQPHAEEPVDLEPAVRLVIPPGGVILFSADQLHSTVPNETDLTRWSIDFRTVDLDDVLAQDGAPARDAACTGTSLRDFRRIEDFEAMPAEAVALYDDGSASEGMAVFAPLVPAGRAVSDDRTRSRAEPSAADTRIADGK